MTLQEEYTALLKRVEEKEEHYKIRKHIIDARDAAPQTEHNGRWFSLDYMHEQDDFKNKWINSFFWKNKGIYNAILMENVYNFCTIDWMDTAIDDSLSWEQTLRAYPGWDRVYAKDTTHITLFSFVFCELVIPTPEGPVLKLSDPTGSIMTRPLKKHDTETVTTWINKMMLVDLVFDVNDTTRPVLKKTKVYEEYDAF